MFHHITEWIMNLMQTHGAAMVFTGVIIESVIVPIPSPLIIMGAGVLVVDPTLPSGALFIDILLKIVLPGSIASTIGAFLGYGIGFWGGKPFIDRFGKYIGFGWDDVLRGESLIRPRQALMIFALRALPIMPLSLISAVAGVLRMPVGPFTLWTFLGSIPRCLILAYLGYFTRDSYRNLAGQINMAESMTSAAIVGVVLAGILWLRARMRRPGTPSPE